MRYGWFGGGSDGAGGGIWAGGGWLITDPLLVLALLDLSFDLEPFRRLWRCPFWRDVRVVKRWDPLEEQKYGGKQYGMMDG